MTSKQVFVYVQSRVSHVSRILFSCRGLYCTHTKGSHTTASKSNVSSTRVSECFTHAMLTLHPILVSSLEQF
ncbi:hypothetical protein BD777DRAFT_127159 [Yarrowia lipolytica]|nr:hypothetical protein BD777DRAFT_127159 [Yarrowia lipolytica]